MEMDLVGIKNQNEYYTNHYFTSIFKDNADETISAWKAREKEEGITLPWHQFRDTSRQYYRVRDRYKYSKNEEQSKPYVQEMAELYLNAMGYTNRKSVMAQVADNLTVPVFHEEVRSNGAPLLWAFLCVAGERDEDILQSYIYGSSYDEEEYGQTVELCNDDILAKLFFAGEEAPRFIILIGINQIALIDRNKWSEKRFLQFNLEDIFSRHSESTFMAITVLLHKESLCPSDGACVLDNLDENSHKHSAGVSEALKYALRECIEILGNEVIYDMSTRQGINLDENPVDASELTLECLRYMYRFLFMLFIEARPELGYAPMKSQVYVQGYSLEGIRDVCARVKEASETVSEGYYICDTISELFNMIYMGYPGDLNAYKRALEDKSLHDMFTIEALKAHIFDPEYTKLITNARLRNSAMLQIVDLMSISRPSGSRERRGRISYSALGINQMGAVYEALLSYRGFIAEETLFEVKRAGEKFNELDVGYFIPERELDNYKEEERVRVNEKDPKSPLRKYEKGTFIYRLAGREREKSASYYTPEVLTKCLVKYALKELLEGKTADEILHLTICEPAMGSAAFLNEAINQLAEAYLNKKQEELGQIIEYDKRFEELQKVKMFIADRNVYGVDLNPIAVELAEVSLWLNTIYKGAYVPWFGTQLVCGNSLIGARRQVYYTSKLERGKWYDEAPVRVMPGEKRKRTGVASRVYHFLLGDPGMANYTDKVIKGLEPDNIKIIKDWNKEFTKKYDEDDIKTLLRLSEIIDTLWERTVELRKKVDAATSEPLSVFGHEENMEGTHTTIREKDEIYHKLFKSEHMNNAGPYARLKAAMDYWCALWFWPIDKADLLPSRQEFFFEMSLILEGGIQAVNVNSSAQMKFDMDESGNLRFFTEGDQMALDFQTQYRDLGTVCLDDLRARSERLAIANRIAEEQRFQHWELEFADVFEENGGFDLVIGNPPWIKLEWNETSVLGDLNPQLIVKKMASSARVKLRDSILNAEVDRKMYLGEYIGTAGALSFYNSTSNYPELAGQQTDLFKCFLPMVWRIGNHSGVSALVHPNSVYDDANGGTLRKCIYPRLRKHFRFENEFKLFREVGNAMKFSLNVYSNCETEAFEAIFNLFTPVTIDECYSVTDVLVQGIKDDNDNWSVHGCQDRIIHVGNDELKVFSNLFGDGKKIDETSLPIVHAKQLLSVMKCFENQTLTMGNIENDICSSVMFEETGSQIAGIMTRDVHYPSSMRDTVYSGPHIGVACPIYQNSQENCPSHRAFDKIDLLDISEDYIQRINYMPCISDAEFLKKIPTTPWGTMMHEEYRICMRKMLNRSGERTLLPAIVAPKSTHIDGIFGIAMKNNLVLTEGCMASLPYDFFVKIAGKANIRFDIVSHFPVIKDSKFNEEIIIRALLLNCLNSYYKELWKETVALYDLTKCNWAKDDVRLDKGVFAALTEDWTWNSPLRDEYSRREALVELDVLVSMALGMTCDQLKTIYRIQFPVLKQYEADTWYDTKGRIVFTSNRSLSGVGYSRSEWEKIKNSTHGEFEQIIVDDTLPIGKREKKITYVAPFDCCDREQDYEEVWHTFEERFANK